MNEIKILFVDAHEIFGLYNNEKYINAEIVVYKNVDNNFVLLKHTGEEYKIKSFIYRKLSYNWFIKLLIKLKII